MPLSTLLRLFVLSASCLIVAFATSATAQNRPSFPPLGAKASPPALIFDNVTSSQGNVEHVAIDNLTACEITYRVQSAPRSSRAIQTRCSSHTTIAQGGSASCRVEFTPFNEARHQRVLEVTYGYSDRCLFQEINAYENKLWNEHVDKNNQLLRLKAQGPDFSKIDNTENEENERHRIKKEELKEALWQLRNQAPEVQQLEEALQEKRNELGQTIRRQIEILDRYRQRGPDFGPIEEQERQTREDARKELDKLEADVRKTCAEIGPLEEEKKNALDELRQGYFCSQCSRSASQIRRETNQSFEQHLRRVKGHRVPAPQEVIDKTIAHYDNLIERAREKCRQERAQLPGHQETVRHKAEQRWNQLQNRRQAITDRYNDRVNAAEGQIGRLRTQAVELQRQYQDRIDQAIARHQEKIARTEQAIKDNDIERDKALERLEERRDELRKAHREELERRQNEVNRLRQEQADFKRWVQQQREIKKHFTINIEGNLVREQED